MKGIRFTKFIPKPVEDASFEEFRKIFLELLNYTAGDVNEALDWMNQLDNQYGFSNAQYGMGDFIDDLKEKGYLSDDNPEGSFEITAKTEQAIRQNALEEIFGKLKKTSKGNHKTPHVGTGDDISSDLRNFQFGDPLDAINMTRSIQNAQINHGLDEFKLTQDDLEIQEREHKRTVAPSS